ncbi:MAG: hypothetical protein JW934_12605, partial [Anaerolineae bacterium]|nr:hypothetical protein [Anaerolineae bacterium]
MNDKNKRSSRNKTITLSNSEIALYKTRFLHLQRSTTVAEIINRTICQNLFEILHWLPVSFVDLLFIDPPYNIDKSFNEHSFSHVSSNITLEWNGIRRISGKRIFHPGLPVS